MLKLDKKKVLDKWSSIFEAKLETKNSNLKDWKYEMLSFYCENHLSRPDKNEDINRISTTIKEGDSPLNVESPNTLLPMNIRIINEFIEKYVTEESQLSFIERYPSNNTQYLTIKFDVNEVNDIKEKTGIDLIARLENSIIEMLIERLHLVLLDKGKVQIGIPFLSSISTIAEGTKSPVIAANYDLYEI